MNRYQSLIDELKTQVKLNEPEIALFTSALTYAKIRRRGLLDQIGFTSRHRSYVVKGAFRSYVVDTKGLEHTMSIAIEGQWTGDPASYLTQKPAKLYVEAIEPSEVIQWSYEAEQMLLSEIPKFKNFMTEKAQQIAVGIQSRLISRLTLTAEERYEEFVNERPELLTRVPIYVIATYLGMSREFLSKIRNNKL